MTVETTVSKSGPYAGAGTTGPFTVGFRFLENSHLLVVQTDVSGVETVLTLSSDYIASGAGSDSGGAILTTVAVPVGQTITILRRVPITQLTDYLQSDAFPAESHEDALDKLTMIAQQLGESVNGAIRVPETTTSLPLLPIAATRANTVLGFDAFGNPTAVIPTSGSAAAVALALASFQAAVASDVGDAQLGSKTTLTGAVATTQGQINEERTSVFQAMTPTQIAAIAAATGTSAAICSAALQACMDGVKVGSFLGLNTYPVGTYQLDATLRVKNGTPRIALRGDDRIRCVLRPNAISIAQAPMSVNALIAVQDNNAHFCMENMRMTASVAYTGGGIYSVEGGGSDGTGQCLYSGLFKNLWIDFPSTNTGFLTGATQNTVFDTITFENMKGCFTLVGAGNGDNFHSNISLYNCYDQHILQTADTNGSFATSVKGVHAYNHQRGRLYDVQNWIGGNFDDIAFEPDAANLGTTGVFKFKNCIGTNASNFYALTRSGVPACAVGIEIDTHVGKFSNGAVTADIGLKVGGTGAHDVVFIGVDFKLCTTAAMQFATAASGRIRTIGCKFNDSTINAIATLTANGVSWYSTDDEFLNAGLGGSAGARNLVLNSGGEIILTRPRIGQNNGSAAAAYFLEANGSGTVTLIDPIWVGAAPIARLTGSQTVNILITQPTGVVTVTAATYTVLESDRDIICNRAGTVTLTLPAAASYPGRRLNIRTVQAQTVVSAASNVCPAATLVAGTAILAATAGKGAELVSDGTAWQNMISN